MISDPAPAEEATPSDETKETSQVIPSEDCVAEDIDAEEVVQTDGECVERLSNIDEKFAEKWTEMFELLFREIPTIYYPLEKVIPPIKDNIITVTVKNELMKENFESRIRLALEYLRNHYSPQVNDIQVVVKTDEKPKEKLIYDTQDKMNDLRIQNPDLPEFLDILKLSAKDF